MVLGTPTTLTPAACSWLATPRVSSPPIATSASTPRLDRFSLIRSRPDMAARGRRLAERVGPGRAEDRAAARQDAADRLHVEDHGVALERAPPAVTEPDELKAVLSRAGPHDRADHCIQAGAVTASGQDPDSHGSPSSALLAPSH